MNTQIQNLWEEVRELSLGSTQIPHLPSPPSPLDFLRDFISPNKPLLISNAVSHWPATTKWTSTTYLLHSLSSSTVSLHLTPTGKADSLTPSPSSPLDFVSAHVGGIGFDEVLERGGERKGCLEKKNDCFRSDCEDHVTSPLVFESAHVEKVPFDEAIDEVLEDEVEKVGDLEQQNDKDCEDHVSFPLVFESAHVEKLAFGEPLDVLESEVEKVEKVGDLKQEKDCFRSEYKGSVKDCERLVSESTHVEKIPFDQALDEVQESEVNRVGYFQQQSGCFRSENNGLGIDCENHVSSSYSPLVFASAHVEKVPFDKALDEVLKSSVTTRVGYLQQQNDCFRSEYKGLGKDCEDHVPWASEALGCLPEAVNLWIGNGLSETSFHKDHYENLYVVISGEKHFLLLPPTDVHRMYVKEYPAAQYHYSKDTQEFRLELEDPVRYVPWCSVNPYPSEVEKEKALSEFSLYFNGPKPFEVTVKAGQMLYLPSMWFHHVRQTPDERGLTVAINYWYDMRFDIKYAYFNFLQSIHYSSPKNSASGNGACKELSQGEPPYCEEED